MQTWVAHISRAGMMGLAWAAVWVPAGMVTARLILGELDPEHIGGPLYAGFICGAMFSELAGIASGQRRLDELAPARAMAWGAASGLFGGVLPFVLGDNGSYQAGWSLTIVAISAIAAGIAAGRLRGLSFVRAATPAAVVSGVLAGVVPWILGNQNRSEWFLPLAVIGALSLMSALSALVSPSIARWSKPHDSEASRLRQGSGG